MGRKCVLLFMLALLLPATLPAAGAAGQIKFEPVRAPSKGPADAPVTIIEIADFM